jgi:hypothetical protein
VLKNERLRSFFGWFCRLFVAGEACLLLLVCAVVVAGGGHLNT